MSGHVHQGLIDHAGVDKAFHALLAEVAHTPMGDRELSTLFQTLADRLRAHLVREEVDIAKFADFDPEDARTLLRDHAELRATLDALTAAAVAGTLSESSLRHFKLRVVAHEAHEETGLYRWLAGA